ncbi:hypothetical protein WR25_09071 isoform A [Diploscapter pachys]|uniref:BTB domain-containing protein n=1 Tax=Diploscapter pachys TaxID=2018661 RepID=A0A2A2JMW2_9BILA|nr:hypothetical protein WR25_09071 isoform A [Diploscapter pachys]
MADLAPLRPADSWSNTEIRSVVHNHVWTIKNFSHCDCRYLETTAKVKDQSTSTGPQLLVDPISASAESQPITFRIRLHPQGNKESNKDFSFFQCFPNNQQNVSQPQFKAKYKFTVFNSRGEEIPTTVYTGTQQLHGYFEYIRRDLLISHVQPADELQLQLTISVTFDTITRVSQAPTKQISYPEPRVEEVAQGLSTMYTDGKLADFTIIVKDRQFNTHKVVLAARSPVFAAMLEPHTEEAQKGRVTISDVDCDVMDEMLRFIYSGSCPRLSQFGLELLAAADRFHLPGLKAMADQALRNNLAVDSACRNLVFADMYNALDLKQEAIRFIVYNISNVIQTDNWIELTNSHPNLVTEIVASLIGGDSKKGNNANIVPQINLGSPVNGLLEAPPHKRMRFSTSTTSSQGNDNI